MGTPLPYQAPVVLRAGIVCPREPHLQRLWCTEPSVFLRFDSTQTVAVSLL